MKKIFLTVDTECHDLSKANQYIFGYKGKEAFGIVKILKLAEELNLPVNFFLDVGECRKYGKEFIKDIVDTIHSYNQPVFFHLHPDYISGDSNRTYLWEYSKEEQRQIIYNALEDYKSFVDFNESDILVFRAGRYGVNSDTYDVLSELNCRVLDLSYLCHCYKMCRISAEEIKVYNIPTQFKNVFVLPNTRFIAFDLLGRKKCIGLDSADATYFEFKQIIKKTRLDNIVFTMHSWNFIRKWFFFKNYFQGDRMMERKFKKSVAFARKHGFEFEDLRYFNPDDKSDVTDELINIYEKNKINCIVNNFFRFMKIARLNKKYFIAYSLFFSTLFFVMLLILLMMLF